MEDGGALLERADSGAAGDEDHGINDRFFLSARASPSYCSCAVFQPSLRFLSVVELERRLGVFVIESAEP